MTDPLLPFRPRRGPRAIMRQQSPDQRVTNFTEVPQGFSPEEALAEASRCLRCKNPTCQEGCPVHIRIRDFIQGIAEQDDARGRNILVSDNALPSVCGRVCPQESQCEARCALLKTGQPIHIGGLERFLGDLEVQQTAPVLIRKKLAKDGGSVKVAVVGSGPAGLTVAAELAKVGYETVIFEGLHIPGGVLSYGIPEFRLPKRIVSREIDFLKSLGVTIQPNVVIGRSLTLDDLWKQGYSAVFIGVGAGTPQFMKIPGENLQGVYSANEFLTRVNLLQAWRFPEVDTPVRVGRRVAVVGGGNVAMDSARVSRRLPGVESVTIVYRRSEKELPCRREEVEHAKEEGIRFLLLANPVEIFGNTQGRVEKMSLVRMELTEPDASGRRGVKAVAGSEFFEEFDTVISALGTAANALLTRNVPGLALNARGYIVTDRETGATSLPGVFAGGDIATGSATVIAAMGAGKRAAIAIDQYLQKKTQA